MQGRLCGREERIVDLHPPAVRHDLVVRNPEFSTGQHGVHPVEHVSTVTRLRRVLVRHELALGVFEDQAFATALVELRHRERGEHRIRQIRGLDAALSRRPSVVLDQDSPLDQLVDYPRDDVPPPSRSRVAHALRPVLVTPRIGDPTTGIEVGRDDTVGDDRVENFLLQGCVHDGKFEYGLEFL